MFGVLRSTCQGPSTCHIPSPARRLIIRTRTISQNYVAHGETVKSQVLLFFTRLLSETHLRSLRREETHHWMRLAAFLSIAESGAQQGRDTTEMQELPGTAPASKTRSIRPRQSETARQPNKQRALALAGVSIVLVAFL